MQDFSLCDNVSQLLAFKKDLAELFNTPTATEACRNRVMEALAVSSVQKPENAMRH
jgi:hypothetical protein